MLNLNEANKQQTNKKKKRKRKIEINGIPIKLLVDIYRYRLLFLSSLLDIGIEKSINTYCVNARRRELLSIVSTLYRMIFAPLRAHYLSSLLCRTKVFCSQLLSCTNHQTS